MASSCALVPTDAAARYLQQLCKHWSHKLRVEHDEARGIVHFPHDARGAVWPGDALLTLDALPDALAVRIDATSVDQLEALQRVVAEHLDRFAFREGPLSFPWEVVNPPGAP